MMGWVRTHARTHATKDLNKGLKPLVFLEMAFRDGGFCKA
jgi:hypothetical protein